jgi:membrane-associated phospholipid phosphatase
LAAAAFQSEQRWPANGANGDESDVPRFAAVYSKALPHNRLGEVNPEAYALLLRALRTGSPRDFDFIPRVGEVKLTNPQAGLSFNLVGPDPSVVACPPSPRFGSVEQAAEMIELYWQALLRDVPFSVYGSHSLVGRAAEELGRLRGRKGVAQGPGTTSSMLFRGDNAGSLVGPYVSQFLWKEVVYSPLLVEQKIRPAPASRDHLDRYDPWLDAQNGAATKPVALDAVPCYVRNGRDLAEYVHRDFSYQAALSAGLILLNMEAPLNPGNPYARSRGQSGFVTFGAPHLLYLLATASQAALTACWFQKWMVHRRLRPEELGGRLENHLAKRATYPFHPSVLDSAGLADTLNHSSSALLSSSYPEGSPTHPAYPAGHAVLSAAGTTVLKAFFDETYVLREPVVPSADGVSLERFDGPPLTVGGELDKLATNIGMGRCFAGIHWRSDIEAGLCLGEEVAISVLREIQLTANEPSSGFRFHRLDGQSVAA